MKAITASIVESQANFAVSGGIAEELLYSIKTVVSFANFKYEKERFQINVDECLRLGKKIALTAGLAMGFLYLMVFGAYALAIWYGGKLLKDGLDINPVSKESLAAGDIITVLFATITGAFGLGMAAPNFRAISDACTSAYEFFEVYEREPKIELGSSTLKPLKESIQGNIKFAKVKFSYPSKPNDLILDEIDLNFEAGKKTAIVGESGSGKTTIIHLIERLYEIQGGDITLDNINIKDIELNYHRSVIGYVSQEPVLFNTSIRENILFGRQGEFNDEQILAVEIIIN